MPPASGGTNTKHLCPQMMLCVAVLSLLSGKSASSSSTAVASHTLSLLISRRMLAGFSRPLLMRTQLEDVDLSPQSAWGSPADNHRVSCRQKVGSERAGTDGRSPELNIIGWTHGSSSEETSVWLWDGACDPTSLRRRNLVNGGPGCAALPTRTLDLTSADLVYEH